MTMNETESLAQSLDARRDTSGIARLSARLQNAWRTGGAGQLARDIRQMALWRLHIWFLDRVAGGPEHRQIGETTHLHELTIASENRAQGVEYTPTPVLVSRWIHRFVPGDPQDWNFIDIGAGRGRVVAEAAKLPYRRVVGVEFAAELVAEAKAHLATLDANHLRAAHVEMVEADATTWPLSPGNNVYFLFNPFGRDVLRRFVEHIKANPDGGRIILIYLNPVHDDVLQDDAAFSPIPLTGRTSLLLRALSPFRVRVYQR